MDTRLWANRLYFEVMFIWQSYMRSAGWRIIWKKIIVIIDTTFAVAKRKPEKNSGLYGIWTLDLFVTGAVLLPIRLGWWWSCEYLTLSYIRTVMIFFHIILHPAVSYKDCIFFYNGTKIIKVTVPFHWRLWFQQCISLQILIKQASYL